MTSEIKVDTISEQTSANGVTIDGLTIKDGNIQGSPALVGTTPSFTIGDGGAEDTKIVFDGNALDYYIGLDDSADNLIIGSGSTVGSNSLITIDSDGDFTLDVTGGIVLDGDDSGTISFKDGGTRYGLVQKASDNFEIQSMISDGDILLKGNDGGSTITALLLDMSQAGRATFNEGIVCKSSTGGDFGVNINTASGDTMKLQVVDTGSAGGADGVITVTDGDLLLDVSHDIILDSDAANWRFKDGGTSILEIGSVSSGPAFYSAVSNADMLFKGNDGGSAITALTLDMSASGSATFNNNVQVNSTVIGASDLNLQSNDGNEKLTLDASGTQRFHVGGAEKMRLTTTGLGIGTSSPADMLDISGTNPVLSFIETDQSNKNYKIGSFGSSFAVYDTGAGQFRYIIDTNGNHIFNEGSADCDFRVESNGNANMLYVDGGSDFVAIGTNDSNSSTLNVSGATTSNQIMVVDSTSSSYGGDGIQRIFCSRANTTAYEFMRVFSGAGSDVEFILRGDGNAFADNAWNASGADYAEYFEWKDGNSASEDRRGYSVILDGNKIVQATDSDDTSKIIGVISGNPAMVGDGAYTKWNDKYLKDDFGVYIREEYTVTEWSEGGDKEEKYHSYETDKIPSDVTVPDNATVITTEEDGATKLTRRKINPSYDETKDYVPRENRKEWDTVGLMGKLRLRKGQPTGTNWIKMRDISDTVEEWLVR
jgi:hypothetical protein